MPELQPYIARDGATLEYRLYESSSATDKVLILLHGSGWHSMQFYPLASSISENGLAHVITPDLRGHGFHPENRGDVDYIGQLEDDLADLIDCRKTAVPEREGASLAGTPPGAGWQSALPGAGMGPRQMRTYSWPRSSSTTRRPRVPIPAAGRVPYPAASPD